ncbi:MAG: ferritin family protein [Chloroflexi bacterium]|nr:ferritin family protein [Chloroflexota bacterium]
MDAIEALKLGAERERGANRFYREAADSTLDPKGKRVFTWLAKEELRHLAKLRQQLKSVLDKGQWLEWRRRRSPVAFTEQSSEVTGTVKVGAAERDALTKGIEAEKKAIVFYREAAAVTSDARGKAMYRALGKEEEGHLALLEEELEWVTKSHKFTTPHRFPPYATT